MNRIELFSEEHCKGVSKAIEHDMLNLADVCFLERAKSLHVVICEDITHVTGDPWVVFTQNDYGGEFELYTEGTYDSIPDFAKRICPLRVVKGGLLDPEITLYENVWFGGKHVTVTAEVPSLVSYGMENMVSSHKVQRGAWRLYQGENYEGIHMVALAGDGVPNYCLFNWNDKAASLKPYKEY